MAIGSLFIKKKMPFGGPKSSKNLSLGGLGGTLAGLGGSRGPKETLLGVLGPHFGDDASPTFDFWSKKGAHGTPKAPKMGPKWLQNRSKNRFKFHVFFVTFLDHSGRHFGSQNGDKFATFSRFLKKSQKSVDM